MSGGGGQTTNQSSEPWGGIQPFLSQGYGSAAGSILHRPQRFYPEPTVAGFASQTKEALGRQEARAGAGSDLLRGAQDYTHGLLTDPRSSPVYDAVMSEVRPGIDSAFAAGRRTGSPAHNEALGRGLARGLSPFMESAAGRAPALAREDYFDIGQLGAAGGAREAETQQQIDAERERFDFGQREPADRTLAYMQALSGFPNVGGTGTSTTQNSMNPWLTGAGLGLGALGTAGGLGWAPLGMGGMAGK